MSTAPDDAVDRDSPGRPRRKPTDRSWASGQSQRQVGRRRSSRWGWLPRWPWTSRRGNDRGGGRTASRGNEPRTTTVGQGRVVDLALVHARYWMRARRITWLIVGLWFALTFVATWFARELDFVVFGWPFSFYLAAQGAPILYIVLVIWYGRRMEWLDRRYGVEERDLS